MFISYRPAYRPYPAFLTQISRAWGSAVIISSICAKPGTIVYLLRANELNIRIAGRCGKYYHEGVSREVLKKQFAESRISRRDLWEIFTAAERVWLGSIRYGNMEGQPGIRSGAFPTPLKSDQILIIGSGVTHLQHYFFGSSIPRLAIFLKRLDLSICRW